MRKTIIAKVSSALAVAALLALPSITAQAQTISWSMDVWGFDNAPGFNGGLPVPNTYAGVDLVGNWNDSWNENGSDVSSSGVTVNNLWDSTGANSGASITYAAFNNYELVAAHLGPDGGSTGPIAPGSGSATPNIYNMEMLNGYLNAGPATWGPPITYTYATFDNIPYAQYNVYVYFNANISSGMSVRPGAVSDGPTTYDFTCMGTAAINGGVAGGYATLTATADTTGADPGADYAEFTGLTGSSQTFTVSPLDLSPSDAAWLGITAIQIEAVPEPGTLALVAMAGAGLMLFNRRIRH
jgi:hypothetical protein